MTLSKKKKFRFGVGWWFYVEVSILGRRFEEIICFRLRNDIQILRDAWDYSIVQTWSHHHQANMQWIIFEFSSSFVHSSEWLQSILHICICVRYTSSSVSTASRPIGHSRGALVCFVIGALEKCEYIKRVRCQWTIRANEEPIERTTRVGTENLSRIVRVID